MHVTVRMAEGDQSELASLYSWVVRDSDVVRVARIEFDETARSEEMGFPLEAINFVLGNSIALASLVTSIVAYRQSRAQSQQGVPVVEISRGDIVASIQGDSPGMISTIIESLSSVPSASPKSEPQK